MLKKVKQIFLMAWLFLASFAAIPNIVASLTKPYTTSGNVEDFFSRIIVLGLTFLLIFIPTSALDTTNPEKSFWTIKTPTQTNQLTPIFTGVGLAVIAFLISLFK